MSGGAHDHLPPKRPGRNRLVLSVRGGKVKADVCAPVERIETIDSYVRLEPELVVPKVGRNDPCPCGSRKKSKRCCR